MMVKLEIIHYLGVAMLLDYVTSLSFDRTLTILDKSIADDDITKCDLAVMGRNNIFSEEPRGRAMIPLSNMITGNINKEKLHTSACLIMITNENTPFQEMVDLVGKLQLIKPVGVLYEVNDWKNASRSINGKSPPFPLILKETGKYVKKNSKILQSLDNTFGILYI